MSSQAGWRAAGGERESGRARVTTKCLSLPLLLLLLLLLVTATATQVIDPGQCHCHCDCRRCRRCLFLCCRCYRCCSLIFLCVFVLQCVLEICPQLHSTSCLSSPLPPSGLLRHLYFMSLLCVSLGLGVRVSFLSSLPFGVCEQQQEWATTHTYCYDSCFMLLYFSYLIWTAHTHLLTHESACAL